MNDEAGGVNEAEPDKPESSAPYLKMIEDATKVFQTWWDKTDKIAEQYANLKRLAGVDRSREMQMFWANIEVLKTVVYARPPQPVVVGRFKDRKPIIRKTSDVLERCLMASFDTEGIHDTMIAIRNDMVLFGRGVAPWVRYEVPNEQSFDAVPEDEAAEAYMEYVCYDHIHRKDFLHEPARKWKEVGWVARKVWLTPKQGMDRFGERWTGIEYTSKENDTEDEYKVDKKACVWEIWDKTQKAVIWVTPGKDDVLDMRAPHLNLEGFFPCAKPAFSTCEPDTLMPVPDMLFYKDQLEEINMLTNRIAALSEALKLKGFYAAGAEDLSDAIERVMRDNSDNATLVPVPTTAVMGSGGVKDAIAWLPVNEIVQVIAALVQERRNLIDDVYQITGISDIMRGDTQASETATAQNIKAQYGSVRVKERQGEMIRLADQTERLAAEIMAENFQIQTLRDMSQVDDIPSVQDVQQQLITARQQIAAMPPEQQEQAMQQATQTAQNTVTWEAIAQLLQNQRVRPFVFQIASDSTIQPNEDQEKQRRNEYAQAVGMLLTNSAPLVQAFPGSAPMVGEMLQFVTSAYRAGKQMEGVIDNFVEQLEQAAAQPQQQGPSPEEIQAQAEQQRLQVEQQAEMQRMQFEQQMAQLDIQMKQMDAAAKERELGLKSQLDMQKAETEALKGQLALRQKEIDLEIASVRLAESKQRKKANGRDRHTN